MSIIHISNKHIGETLVEISTDNNDNYLNMDNELFEKYCTAIENNLDVIIDKATDEYVNRYKILEINQCDSREEIKEKINIKQILYIIDKSEKYCNNCDFRIIVDDSNELNIYMMYVKFNDNFTLNSII